MESTNRPEPMKAHVGHSPDRIIQDIDEVLLAEEKLLEALKMAVAYNNLDEADAEQVLWDFKNERGLRPGEIGSVPAKPTL